MPKSRPLPHVERSFDNHVRKNVANVSMFDDVLRGIPDGKFSSDAASPLEQACSAEVSDRVRQWLGDAGAIGRSEPAEISGGSAVNFQAKTGGI